MSNELTSERTQSDGGIRPRPRLAVTVLSLAWGTIVLLFMVNHGPYNKYSYLAAAAVVAAVAIAVHIDLNRILPELDLALKDDNSPSNDSRISERRTEVRDRATLLGALMLANAHIYALHIAWGFNTCFGSDGPEKECENGVGWVFYNLVFGAELWVFLVMHGYLLISASTLQDRTVRRTEDFARSRAFASIYGGQDRLSKLLKESPSREIDSEVARRRRMRALYVWFFFSNVAIVALIGLLQSTIFDTTFLWDNVIAASIIFVPLLTFLAVNILQSRAFISFVRKEYLRGVSDGDIEKRPSTLWGYTLSYWFFFIVFSLMYLMLVWFFYSIGEYVFAVLFFLPIVLVRIVFWRWLRAWLADPVVYGELKNVDFSSFDGVSKREV